MLGLDTGQWEGNMTRLLSLLFHQGVLDEQFTKLQQLQDGSSPNFVAEVISIYFKETEKLLTNLRALLADEECADYRKISIHVNHLVGSSSSVGARRLRDVCVAFREASELRSWNGCMCSLAFLEQEYCYLKNKLHELFQIEQQSVIENGVRYLPFLQ
ncbi:hypothetical protein HPP92_006347 [Vanilla planifolia]|uniref:Histidine-containing phosphotransfer protein n=1 Tax=Vanilla planifolia TaxID=51239 RepID=A0A835RK59_VANPL|nr:hypothetical protein HPP92_006347 [Vanilla planifolia]